MLHKRYIVYIILLFDISFVKAADKIGFFDDVYTNDEVRYYDPTTGNYISFKSPSSLTGNTSFIWPNGDGSNGQILQTNGSGVFSWTNDDTGSGYSVTSKTANYTTTNTDDLVLVDATSGNITITTHTASGNIGDSLIIKKIDTSTNTVTVDPNSTETIDGVSTYVLKSEGEKIEIVSDGTNWERLTSEVVSGSGSGVKIGSAEIANGGTASISIEVGNWITSVTRNGAGDVSLNLVSGYFPNNPSCVTSFNGDLTAGGNEQKCSILSSSTSSVRVTCDNGASGFDADFNVECKGER